MMPLSLDIFDPRNLYFFSPSSWDWLLFTVLFSLVFKLGMSKLKKEHYGDSKSDRIYNALAFILGLTVSSMLVFVQGFSLQSFVSSGYFSIVFAVMCGLIAFGILNSRTEHAY